MSEFLEVLTQLLLMCTSAAYNALVNIAGAASESIRGYATDTTYGSTLSILKKYAAAYPDAFHMGSGAIFLNLIWRYFTKRIRAGADQARRKVRGVGRNITKGAKEFASSMPAIQKEDSSYMRLSAPRDRYVIDADYEEYDYEEYED